MSRSGKRSETFIPRSRRPGFLGIADFSRTGAAGAGSGEIGPAVIGTPVYPSRPEVDGEALGYSGPPTRAKIVGAMGEDNRTTPMTPPPREFVAIMKDVLARGGSTDDALVALRASGADMFDSLKVVIEVLGTPLGEAKWVVDG